MGAGRRKSRRNGRARVRGKKRKIGMVGVVWVGVGGRGCKAGLRDRPGEGAPKLKRRH